MADKKFLTVGDFNRTFSNCTGFSQYTKKNSNYFVTNEELDDMYKTSGAGDVNLSGYNNKKFTTDFPQWVDKITPVECSITFDVYYGTGTQTTTDNGKKLICTANTHKDHIPSSNNRTIFGYLYVGDTDGEQGYMQFAFSEWINVGNIIDLSSYVRHISAVASNFNNCYSTRPLTTEDCKNSNLEYKSSPFNDMHFLFQSDAAFLKIQESYPLD